MRDGNVRTDPGLKVHRDKSLNVWRNYSFEKQKFRFEHPEKTPRAATLIEIEFLKLG